MLLLLQLFLNVDELMLLLMLRLELLLFVGRKCGPSVESMYWKVVVVAML